MQIEATETFEKNILIYLHIKLDNGEPFYIGKGTIKRMNTMTSRNKMWHNIVKKHGYDIIILEDNLTEDIAFEREKYWINRIGRRDLGLGPLVNFTDGGEGITGYRHTDETKERLSKKHTGKKISEQAKLKMSLSKKGENRGLVGENHGMYGKEHSIDSKKLMSEKMIGKNKGSNHYTYNEIPVIQYDKDGNFIKEWNNHREVIAFYSLNLRSFNQHLNNKKYKTQGGFIWKYKQPKHF